MPAHKKKTEDLINKQIITRLTKEEHYELKIICVEKENTISNFVRSLIKNAIKQSKK